MKDPIHIYIFYLPVVFTDSEECRHYKIIMILMEGRKLTRTEGIWDQGSVINEWPSQTQLCCAHG